MKTFWLSVSEPLLPLNSELIAAKSWRYKRSKPLTANVQRLALAQIRGILAELDQVHPPGPELDEFIHDVRLAGKHLSALLCLLPRNQQRKQLRRKIKRMMQRLSAARDALIRTQVLNRDELAQISKQLPRSAERAYRKTTKQWSDERWSKQLRHELEQICKGFRTLDAEIDQHDVEHHLGRCYAAAKKATPHPEALSDLNLEQWHLWRRKCKTLMILISLFEDTFNKPLGDLAEGLRCLTHDLGELQDLDVTLKLAKSKHRQRLFSAMAVEMADLAMACQARGKALLRMSAQDFKQQLRAAVLKKPR